MKLLLATRNRCKAREISQMMGCSVETLDDLGFEGEIIETGATFEENAILKAKAVAAFLQSNPRFQNEGRCVVLADDSGLEVDALGGAPGVFSARYAGEPTDDAANNGKVLQALEGISEGRRGAQFRCVLAAIFCPQKKGPVAPSHSEGEARTFEGIVRGRIGHAPKGTHGFGYDPLFLPEGHSQTTAEMSPEEKNRISHRSRALDRFKHWLAEIG